MSKKFVESLKKVSLPNKLTENGAAAYDSTLDPIVDAFGLAGALRSRTDEAIEAIFEAAYVADPELAVRLMFYTGDIRLGGLGERRTFRVWLKWLAKKDPELVKRNLHLVPYYNRWDSLWCLIDTPCEDKMWDFIKTQLRSDLRDPENCSLLAKWMPSENAHSKTTKALAHYFMTRLGLSPREYRKKLSILRAHCSIVEQKMSTNTWGSIKYDTVPSMAMNRYNSAFSRHDYERFSYYLREVRGGIKKINSGVLYPYNIVEKMWRTSDLTERETLEMQWKSLPNYVKGANDYLVMADVSGSMSGRPMATSVGLAIYFAERNEGLYKNQFMTFTSTPTIQTLDPSHTLYQKIDEVTDNVGYSTNLEAAFNLIYTAARNSHATQADMPEALIVISDMEIDRYMSGSGMDFLGAMELKFARLGLDMPKIVFWNVDARSNTFLSTDPRVINVSGQSTSTFKFLCDALEGKTAYEFVVEVLRNPVYDLIQMED